MLFDTADRASTGPKDCTFQDVAIDSPYAEAIAWAKGGGYLCGYGDGRFGPEDATATEQAMAMIHRFFGSPAANLSILDGVEGSGQISPWARQAVAQTKANGFLRSTERVSPQSPIAVENLTYALGQIVAGG